MITVVTVTFNNYEELILTLDSLKPALGEGVESLVINGGSCEQTKEFLETYSGRSISEPDQGIADAFNKGVVNAKGDYIAILNSGDLLLESDYYKKALEVLKQDPGLAYVYGNSIYKHGYLGDILVRPQMDLILRQMPFLHCSMVTSKKLLVDYGLFNLEYKIAMDYDFLIKIHKDNYRGAFLDTEPAFLMDGTGISSVNGLAGIAECMSSLKREGMLTFENWRYFTILRAKNYARKVLTIFGVIGFYDRVRHGEKTS